MRILHIFYEIRYSGAEIMYANAAPLFIKNDCELLAFNTSEFLGEYSSVFEKNGIKVFHKPFVKKKSQILYGWKYFYYFFLFLKRNQIDVVHLHRAQFYWFYAFVARIARIKTVRTIHSCFRPEGIRWLKTFLGRHTAKLFFDVVFTSIGDSVFANELSYFKNRTHLIYNWYNNFNFYPALTSEKKKLRNRYNIPYEDIVLISVGSCLELKRHKDIIYAFSKIVLNTNCYYIHIGTGTLENEEKLLAQQLGCSNKILFIGNTTQVREYLVMADIFIMTSDYEGLGMAAIEAMACGLPLILYKSLGLKDLISENDCGLLIEKNKEILADKIIYLSSNKELQKIMSKNAVKKAEIFFNMNNSVNKFINLYRS
jgi:Glycosyltransferase